MNRQWHAAAATVLWSDVKVNLVETETRTIDTLVGLHATGPLGSGKKLIIITAA